MREQTYQRKLVKDLEKWVDEGIISEKNAEDIFNTLPESKLTERLPSIIAILGAVLICFGILAFVAANWYGIPKAARLALLGAGMWAAYGSAGILHKRGAYWLFEAAILIGVTIYIAGIVLIAQMYHMDGHYPDAILMAGAGALAAALLVRSIGALIVSIAMLTLWTSLEIHEFDVDFHWPYIIAWFAMAATAFHLRSRINYHLVTMSFAYWVTITVFGLSDWAVSIAIAPLASLAFVILIISLIFIHHTHKDNPDSFASSLSKYAIKALITLIFVLQVMESRSYFTIFADYDVQMHHITWLTGSAVMVGLGIVLSIFWRRRIGFSAIDISGLVLVGVTAPLFSIVGVHDLVTLIPLAICMFLISLWLIIYGQDFDNRHFINLGFVLFGAETLYIYFKTFGTLMNSFVFFTIGGVILILLALGIDRFRKRILSLSIDTNGEQ